ncbi:MAG: glutamine synthetase [Deltaproteobacteria bacterium]|nr:glutamine synthetase [Deltaproteobacteria bacterium]MBW2070540.1 glutamine synthetase [Deltaproteobacteria bacterium]
MSTVKQIREKLKKVDSTKIFFTDLNGRPRSLPINPANIEGILQHGIGFDGSSIAGITTVDDSDRLLVPLPESFKVISFSQENLAFFIGKIINAQGERSKSDARAVLENVLSRAEADYGCKFLVGPEHEFFLLKGNEFHEDIHSDSAGYFHADPHDKGEIVRKRIIEVLADCGIQFEKAHHEVTASQHEINLECGDPLTVADRTVLFNYVMHKVAAEYGLHATLMPKPFDGQNRNAFHIHLSVMDLQGNNRFYDPEAVHNLTPFARQFIGGILKYARETSIIMASTFNSYKAYVLEREAPVVRGWGLKNRSSMVRVPYTSNPQSTRIELRNPDPTGNVYLQFATLISMGLQGIKEGLDCGEPDIGSTYKKRRKYRVWDRRYLPRSMYEALVEAERSRLLKEILGERIYNNYLGLKIADWEEHRTHVTPREHQKYLHI